MKMIGGWMVKYLRAQKQKQKPVRKHRCYVRRNDTLSDIGYAGYKEYLASDEWKEIRGRILDRHPSCLLCQVPASQVHHMSYAPDVLLGLADHLLVSLCDACHRRIEFDGAGNKSDLDGANRTLEALALAVGRKGWLGMVEREEKRRAKRLHGTRERQKQREEEKRQRIKASKRVRCGQKKKWKKKRKKATESKPEQGPTNG